MNYIGIDNGVTGSIGTITENEYMLFKTPVKKELNYTKKKGYISRIIFKELIKILAPYVNNCFCLIERPMINPRRFQASTSALRSFEVTLLALEILKIPFEVIDSKQWQKKIFPAGVKGSTELKKASIDTGKRLFPKIDIKKIGCGDYDGLLIAHYLKTINQNA